MTGINVGGLGGPRYVDRSDPESGPLVPPVERIGSPAGKPEGDRRNGEEKAGLRGQVAIKFAKREVPEKTTQEQREESEGLLNPSGVGDNIDITVGENQYVPIASDSDVDKKPIIDVRV